MRVAPEVAVGDKIELPFAALVPVLDVELDRVVTTTDIDELDELEDGALVSLLLALACVVTVDELEVDEVVEFELVGQPASEAVAEAVETRRFGGVH